MKEYYEDDRSIVSERVLKMTTEERRREIAKIEREDRERKLKMQGKTA